MKILLRVSAGKFKHTYCQVLTTDITVLHEPTDFSTLTNEFVHFLLSLVHIKSLSSRRQSENDPRRIGKVEFGSTLAWFT
jgi:hypothetical protein